MRSLMARAVLVPLLVAAPASVLAAGGKKLYSQGNEELVIRDFFHDRRGGFFLDVGCASPVANSNTYYLEKHLGWSGIAVDALPEYALAWRRKRPRSHFFNYLITDHAETVEPFFRSEFKGTSAVERPSTGPGGKPVKVEEIQVPTTTLTRLLEQQRVSHVDFLSLDIEGHEPPALAGFDIDRFQPALACVEAKPANREKLLKYFADHGYLRIDRYLELDLTNYYFTPKPGAR
jgi:FkbM family methyltransferase